MITNEALTAVESSDAELVSQCLAGNRDSFGRIVARYQTLICSLAYGATGSLSQSQDVSQETFVIAWKQLADLREPDKLRSWLCGIARNRIYKTLRKEQHEPAHAAESLDAAQEAPSREPSPPEETISREEEAILWRSLARIPETYREPLILFYREHQSIERVAAALDLSEDAVKQRLSRGRKLLHEQVVTFVEGALEKTSPGKTFTLGVLAALPAATTPAKAATVATTIAKGAAAAKGAGMAGSLGGMFAMLGCFYIGLRAQASEAKSPREREFMMRMIGIRLTITALVVGTFVVISKSGFFHSGFGRDIWISMLLFGSSVIGTSFLDYSSRQQRAMQMADGTYVEAEWTLPRRRTDSAANSLRELTSRDFFKAARFMAGGLVLFGIMLADAPWKQHLGRALVLFAGCAGSLFLSCLLWYNRPRYQSPYSRMGWIWAPVYGAMILLFFNIHQYRALAEADPSKIAPPATIIGFNVATVLAYAVFAAILRWRARFWKNV